MTPLKRSILLIGVGFALALSAYFSGALRPILNGSVTSVATLPGTGETEAQKESEASQKQKRVNADGDQDEAEVDAEVVGEEQASETQATEKVTAPSFDVVRVEPNGSMVVAGKAAPASKIEIVSGSTALGTATAGSGGDFAVVLDQPLDPGDYHIVLRATTPDNVAATSVETAIITVPDSNAGEVLALVDRPGAPSRLITVPSGKPGDGESAPKASAPAEQAGEDAVAEQGDDSAPREQAQQPAPEAQAEQRAPAEQTEESATTEEAEAPQGQNATSAQAARTQQPADDPAESAAPAAQAQQETAAAEEEAPAVVEEAPGGSATPFIEAVEIDGRSVFVAGAAEAGSRVRAYANELLVGETETAPNGRFLIEALRDLPVGDYIVRVDELMRDGRTVAARAAVPFTREAGEQVAAVARPDQAPAGDADVDDGPASMGAAAAEPQAANDAMAPAAGEASDAPNAVEDGGDEGSAEAATTAPKLEPVDGSVIIRRGDTLWHISRRIYGQGIRYTTIYLANQEQIRNPDLIWPGQVFNVPDTTEEGEPADLETMGDQVVHPNKKL